MRRFFTTSLVLLALFVSTAPVAWAQVTPPDATPPTDAGVWETGMSGGAPADATGGAGSLAGTPYAANNQAAQGVVNQTANNPATKTGEPGDAYSSIMQWVLKLFAWLLGVAAITLNYAVYYTVVVMGNYVKHLSAIGTTWTVLRDIGNIMLIFGFLAVGITTILNVDWYGGGKRMLPMMLVAAVFLNFSLFISEAIIDTGNLFATQFYKQINGGSVLKPPSMTLASVSQEGISNKLMNKLGLQTIYGDGTGNPAIFKPGSSWVIGFMGIILFTITAFVMFSLAFVLIARFIALIFLIILAPIGFAGLAVPMLKTRASQWWDQLFKQTVTAPILLLMLYIALAVIVDPNFFTGFDRNIATGASIGFVDNANLPAFAGFILSFLVAMGLLIAVVIQSKNLSAFGAGWASKMGGRLSFGAVSLAGRATLGMAGVGLANKRMQSWVNKADKKGAAMGGLGGLTLRGLALGGKGVVLGGKGLRSSTYDFRNAPGAAGGLAKLGIEAGTGATITAKQVHDARYGVKPVKEWLQHSAEERTQAEHEMDFKDAQAAIEDEKMKLASGAITQAQYDTNVAPQNKIIADSLSKMSTKQLEELTGIKNGTDALVQNLSPQQFEALMKSDKLNDIEKGKIKTARFAPLTAAQTAIANEQAKLAAGTITQTTYDTNVKPYLDQTNKIVKDYSKGELESMPATMLTNQNVQDALSAQQFETLMKSEKISNVDKDKIKQLRYAKLANAVAQGPLNTSAIKKVLNSLSNTEIESIPATLLEKDEVLDNLSDKQRDTIISGNERSAAEKDKVREASPPKQAEKMFNNPTQGPAAAANLIAGRYPGREGLTPQQVAKLPKNMLMNTDIIRTFIPATLTAIQEEKKLQTPDITAISTAIRGGVGPQSLRDHIAGTVGAAYWG